MPAPLIDDEPKKYPWNNCRGTFIVLYLWALEQYFDHHKNLWNIFVEPLNTTKYTPQYS